ncbi:uncharacterized protein Gasu_36210 [Galdieria sulphuraria]|uniref:Zinc-finger domain-containing protein n=1 Tax=Galdieria sulphuraria TaxID=130081 RepID=M2XFT4_GALSU|nr:uncharacterized protein Gasu_36210 [Galdieria sulphuraria]EME28882.1 hypothetical protein Gasu_36210 [Galdieria sulphuraria]|eukprot:XP_005705402.1 hypothetical protein Gasu_36210 [Galdieria sulphuraria]
MTSKISIWLRFGLSFVFFTLLLQLTPLSLPMNLEQNLEQNYVPRKALQVSMNSEVEEKPLLTQYSVTDSSSEFSLIPHDSMMIETFTKSYNSFSDLGSYFTQYKDDSIEENSIAFPMSSHESSYSYTLISSGNSSMKTKQEENEERQRQVSKQICQDREEMAGKRQKGRPYKVNNAIFSLASSKYIPATYRKSLERAYKTQKPSRWCHVCNRSSIRAHLVPCFNRWYHRCRKSICQFCIYRYYLLKPNVPPCMFAKDKFFCSHCLGICPVTSQCKTYQKTNVRRHIQSLLDKQQK